MSGPDKGADLAVRTQIYQYFAEHGRAPLAKDIADLRDLATAMVRTALRRLHDNHMIFLYGKTSDIRRADPFSANQRVPCAH